MNKSAMTMMMNLLAAIASAFLIASTSAYAPLSNVKVQNVRSEGTTDIGEWLSNGKSLFVFGTYAADFNAIEYGQRLRYYWPKLQQEKGFDKCVFLLSCQPEAALALAEQIDLPESIELYCDNTGQAARQFGVERGWLPENEDVNPFLKLFGMLWGLGAWATLPAVIGGYLGNPFVGQPWIEDALAVGQKKGRWPNNALEIDESDGSIVNKFTELPVVGEWPRRPLELATLRLQSMMGISLAKWKDLAPDEDALANGVLTQLGGCIATKDDSVIYEYKDPGICAVANFEKMMEKV